MINYIVFLIALLLLFVGIFLISYKPRSNDKKSREQKKLIREGISLKDKIDIIKGKNSSKNNLLKNYFFDIKLILAKMNRVDNWGKLKMISLFFGVAGLSVSIIIDNYLMVMLLVPLFAMLPFQYTKYKYKKHLKMLEEELETALSLITISYMRTQSFVTSVQECIPSLPPIVKRYFEDFLLEVTVIDANVDTALINLKTKIENRTFQQWIDRVVVCQENRNVIPSLQGYVDEFSNNRSIQKELDAEIYSAKIEMYMMIGFVFLTPVILFAMQRQAFNHLFTDTVGKITMFVSYLLVVIVFVLTQKIAKPVQFRGNKG